MPGGYLEARGGFDAIKPSGGTAADPVAAGIYTGGHEHTMADGYVYTAGTGGTVFSANLAQRGYFEIWSSTAEAQHDAIYIGSTVGKFSRVVFYIGQALVSGGAAQTFAYEYAKTAAWDTDGNAATSGTFSTTTTPTFTATGEQVLEIIDPGSAWVQAVRNGTYAYWIRIRLSAVGGGITTACRQGATATTGSAQRVYSDWQGARQIYVYASNPTAAAGNGTLKWYGQSSASVVAWNSVSTSLFSGNYARARFASYRNLMYLVNGKESKRWDNNTLADIGFTAPVNNASAYDVTAAGVLTGEFIYAITYGYGPNGEWGESNELNFGSTGGIAAKKTKITLNLSSIPDQAERIYLYRTTDLTSVPPSAQGSFPMFRIQSISRGPTGVFATGAGAIEDNTAAFPFPPVELDVASNAPPTRCKYIGVHKNRLFLGSNNQYPGRVWWSDPFEAESFNTDENFADFTRSTGGQVTGIMEFNDQMVCFTEDQMFGIANVDQDVPSIYEIAKVGCIAPDSIQAGFGVLCWLARNGVYVWDGTEPPQRVSDHTSTVFGSMSYEGHGLSRCILHNRMYEIHLIKNDNTLVQSDRYRYDLVTRTWASMAYPSLKAWCPLCMVTAPPAHADSGVRHPMYGQADRTFTDYAIYLGEMTTQDAGANYTLQAQVHFGPTGLTEAILNKIFAYYYAGDGWGTPTLSLTNAISNYIGSPTGAATNLTADAATDYTRLSAIPAEGSLGSGDILVLFSVASAASGTVRGQRLLSMGIEADGVESDWGKS